MILCSYAGWPESAHFEHARWHLFTWYDPYDSVVQLDKVCLVPNKSWTSSTVQYPTILGLFIFGQSCQFDVFHMFMVAWSISSGFAFQLLTWLLWVVINFTVHFSSEVIRLLSLVISLEVGDLIFFCQKKWPAEIELLICCASFWFCVLALTKN